MRTFKVVYDSYQGFGSHVEQYEKRALSYGVVFDIFNCHFIIFFMSQYLNINSDRK